MSEQVIVPESYPLHTYLRNMKVGEIGILPYRGFVQDFDRRLWLDQDVLVCLVDEPITQWQVKIIKREDGVEVLDGDIKLSAERTNLRRKDFVPVIKVPDSQTYHFVGDNIR